MDIICSLLYLLYFIYSFRYLFYFVLHYHIFFYPILFCHLLFHFILCICVMGVTWFLCYFLIYILIFFCGGVTLSVITFKLLTEKNKSRWLICDRPLAQGCAYEMWLFSVNKFLGILVTAHKPVNSLGLSHKL